MEDKPRYSRISDLLHLIFLMNSKLLGVTLQDIQDEFGVSRRTAERMRDAIMTILPGVDEIETNDKQKHWGFINYSVSDIVSFSSEEISTLEKLKNNFDSATNDDLKKITAKIKTIFNNKNPNIAENLEYILKSEGLAVKQAPAYKVNVEDISLIREAIKNKVKIKAIYTEKERLLTPLGIVYAGKVYLIAKEEIHGQDPYYYLLHKLSKIELTKEKFNPDSFDLKEFSKKSFGIYQGEILKVELLFDKSVKEEVLNYNFHPTQKIKVLDDGNVSVKFSASGNREIIWHLFKWGTTVKIIKPKALKDEYKEYLENVLKVND